jgi:hypothetical protein
MYGELIPVYWILTASLGLRCPLLCIGLFKVLIYENLQGSRHCPPTAQKTNTEAVFHKYAADSNMIFWSGVVV